MNLKKWPVAVSAAIVVALIGAACGSKSAASANSQNVIGIAAYTDGKF